MRNPAGVNSRAASIAQLPSQAHPTSHLGIKSETLVVKNIESGIKLNSRQREFFKRFEESRSDSIKCRNLAASFAQRENDSGSEAGAGSALDHTTSLRKIVNK